MNLKPQDKAPDFDLLNQGNKKVSLSTFRGRKVLLFFYPKAGTPGWKKQAVSLRDAGQHLAKLNVAILGISPDKPNTQKKFDEKNDLGFPLLSDPNHEVAEQYGVWNQEDNFLKKLLGVTRSSFLIDETGKIMAVWYKISPLDTVPEALKVLEG